MQSIGLLTGRLLVIIAVCTIVIAGIYVWLLPTVFPQLRTYSFLTMGLAIAAVLGGYCTLRATETFGAVAMKWLLVLGVGAVTAALVLFLSLLIILNLRGS
jgi:hypothetical protein